MPEILNTEIIKILSRKISTYEDLDRILDNLQNLQNLQNLDKSNNGQNSIFSILMANYHLKESRARKLEEDSNNPNDKCYYFSENYILSTLLPFIQKIALAANDSLDIPVKGEESMIIIVKKSQCACILALAFFGLIGTRLNFIPMFEKINICLVQCLFNYFNKFMHDESEYDLIFKMLPNLEFDWQNIDKEINYINLMSNQTIEYSQTNIMQFISLNESYYLFLTHIELCVCKFLFNLDPGVLKNAISVTGCEYYAVCGSSPSSNVDFIAPINDTFKRATNGMILRTIVIVNPVCSTGYSKYLEDFNDNLNKLACGFISLPSNRVRISLGSDCLGYNKHIAFIHHLLASVINNISIDFYIYNDQDFYKQCLEFMDFLKNRNFLVAELYDLYKSFSKQIKRDRDNNYGEYQKINNLFSNLIQFYQEKS